MQLLFDYFLERLPIETRDCLISATSHQTDLNPNTRLFNGVCLVLEEVLDDIKELKKHQNMKIKIISEGFFSKTKEKRKIRTKRNLIKSKSLNKEIAFELASLSCYLIPKMKTTGDYLSLLKRINHPYIDLYIAYFEEDPSNYQATRLKVEEISKKLKENRQFNKEMKAHQISICSWLYGQQGDVVILKEVYKYVHKRLPKTDNIVEIRALQDAASNAIWWLLHSGVEANIEEMIDFIEPFIQKYKLYMSYTDFLNLKGAALSYFGENIHAIQSFEKLMTEHEKYNDDYRLSIAIGNLSSSYFVEGRILQAKEMMEKAIKLYKESTGKWPYLYLTEIGNMYYLTGDPRAEESFLHAYEIQKKETSLFKAFILFELIHFYLRTEEIEKAKTYLNKLSSLAKELQAISVNAQVTYLLGYSEMLDLNFSNAIKYMQNSLELGRQSKDFDLILSSNILLAAIYLQRYRLSGQQATLNTALNYIDTSIQLAVENQHRQILSLGLIIRSLLRASKGEYEKSFADIENAKVIVNDIDYDKWKEDLLKIEEKIQNSQRQGKMVLDREDVFKYILPQFKTMLSFKLAERKPVESEVIGLLIITQSGVPVYTKLGANLKTDKMILSGLLTAINHLSESIGAGKDKGRLQEVLYDKFWITVQPIKNGFVAVIASEATAEIRMLANGIADRIKEVPIVISELTTNLEDKIQDILDQMVIK